jgi:hypothetical protein
MSSSRRFTSTLQAEAWPTRAYHIARGDSPSLRRVAIFRSMPPPGLAPEEYAEIVRLVRAAIDGDRYPLSPRSRRLKSILAKLDPEAERPYPPPLPSAEPSFLCAKLRGGRRGH